MSDDAVRRRARQVRREALNQPLASAERVVCADGDVARLILDIFATAVSDLDEGIEGYRPYMSEKATGSAIERQARASAYVFFFDVRHGATDYARTLRALGIATHAAPNHPVFTDARAAYRRRRDCRLLGLRDDLLDAHILSLLRRRARRVYRNVARLTQSYKET